MCAAVACRRDRDGSGLSLELERVGDGLHTACDGTVKRVFESLYKMKLLFLPSLDPGFTSHIFLHTGWQQRSKRRRVAELSPRRSKETYYSKSKETYYSKSK